MPKKISKKSKSSDKCISNKKSSSKKVQKSTKCKKKIIIFFYQKQSLSVGIQNMPNIYVPLYHNYLEKCHFTPKHFICTYELQLKDNKSNLLCFFFVYKN